MKSFPKVMLISCIVILLIIVIIIGGSLMYKYHSCKVLCNDIKAGSNIDTNISNGITAPLWTDKIATILQIEGPKIPLVEACYYRNVQAVEVLLSNGADPNKFISGRFSPLEAAIVYGPIDDRSFAIIKLLLEHGADADKFGSESPLIIKLTTYLAAGNNNPIVEEIIMLLLEHNADCYWDGYNRVAFDIVKSGNISLAAAFFDLNSSYINETNTTGQNLLMIAIVNNEKIEAAEMVNVLIRYGIDVNATDANGLTAYDYAIQYELYDIAEILS